jgi:hypothetical protein
MFLRFRPLERFFAGVLCASFAAVLLAASPPGFNSPVTVVMFPFRTGEGIAPSDGIDYATALGNALTQLGGIKVVMGDPATKVTEYLHATAAAGGDYYVTGSVNTPVRNAIAVLEQIVSRRSGTAVWGNTAQISNESDIRLQAPVIRDALVAYTNRGYFAVINATPTPAPTKAPPAKKKNGIETSASGPSGNPTPRKPLDLPNEAYGFSSDPTAKPILYASVSNPSRFAIMGITGAYVPDVMKRYAEKSLVNTLSHHGQPAALGDPDVTKHFLMHPQDVCKQTATQFLVFGTVGTKSADPRKDPANDDDSWIDAQYTPMIYDCTAQQYNRTAKAIHASAYNWRTAVDRATLKATTDFFSKLGKTSAHA